MAGTSLTNPTLHYRDVALAHILGAEMKSAQGRYLLMTSSAPAKLYAKLFWKHVPAEMAAAHTPQGTNTGTTGAVAGLQVPLCDATALTCGSMLPCARGRRTRRAAGARVLLLCQGPNGAGHQVHAYRAQHRRHGSLCVVQRHVVAGASSSNSWRRSGERRQEVSPGAG